MREYSPATDYVNSEISDTKIRDLASECGNISKGYEHLRAFKRLKYDTRNSQCYRCIIVENWWEKNCENDSYKMADWKIREKEK